jgi:ABC-2 type transport system permease protein
MRPLLAQARAETSMTLRRGESVLLALVIPVAALAGLSTLHIVSTGPGKPVDFLTPGIMALAVMSTSFVNLSIATGFERYYGVLKRLAATPLGRWRLVVAKSCAVIAVEVLQLAVVSLVGLALGWHPTGGLAGVAEVSGAALVATAAFSSLGMLVAGTLPAHAVLGLSNALWFVLLLVSGMVAPLAKLPAGLRNIARWLPSGALSRIFHGALETGARHPGIEPWLVLFTWAVVGTVAAARWFRWQ